MNPRHDRRWYQFGLKSLFLLTLIVAVFFAGFLQGERRAEREALRREQAQEELRKLAADAQRARDQAVASPGGQQVFSFYVDFMR